MSKSMKVSAAKNKRMFLTKLKAQGYLQVFALIGLAFIIVFRYLPMFGLIIAFKDYKLVDGILGFFTSQWVGMKYFIEFFTDSGSGLIIRNTLLISIIKLVFTFPTPIIFALVLNEVRNQTYKRVVQTISYLPYFMSWVVVSGMIVTFLNQEDGVINQIMVNIGLVDEPVKFLTDSRLFIPMVVISDMWKGMGWWSIIFLAAMAGIPPTLYEASIIDGANRLQQIWHITLPNIKGTTMVIFILSIGSLFNGGIGGSNFEQCYLLGNNMNYDVSEILQTYTLKMGLAQGRFSYATAISLMEAVISVILIYISNFMSKKISEYSLF